MEKESQPAESRGGQPAPQRRSRKSPRPEMKARNKPLSAMVARRWPPARRIEGSVGTTGREEEELTTGQRELADISKRFTTVTASAETAWPACRSVNRAARKIQERKRELEASSRGVRTHTQEEAARRRSGCEGQEMKTQRTQLDEHAADSMKREEELEQGADCPALNVRRRTQLRRRPAKLVEDRKGSGEVSGSVRCA